LRVLSALAPYPLAGSDVFTIAPPVIWSADSRFFAFTGVRGLRRISLSDGTPQTICETNVPIPAVGGDWHRNGSFFWGTRLAVFPGVPRRAGSATLVTHPEGSSQESHLMPSFLSDGRRFIYLRIVRSKPEGSGIYVGDLGSESTGPGKRLIATGFPAQYVPAADDGSGFIVFAQDGALYAQRFDEAQLTLTGEPRRLADRIGSYLDWASFAVSPTILVYRAPEPPFQLTWFDRQGRDVGHIGAPEHVAGLALSPDGGHAIVAKHAPQSVVDQDLWLYDLSRRANPTLQTYVAKGRGIRGWIPSREQRKRYLGSDTPVEPHAPQEAGIIPIQVEPFLGAQTVDRPVGVSERPELPAQRMPQEPVGQTHAGAHPRRIARDDDAVERRGLARRGPHQGDGVGIAADDFVEGHDSGSLHVLGDLGEIALDPSLPRLVAALGGGLAQQLEIGTRSVDGGRMYGPVPCEFVLEDPHASANIQVREVHRTPFPQ
jgi:hypothetical protein